MHKRPVPDWNNLANDSDRKRFFALGHELGYAKDVLKERAKQKYKLFSFSHISQDQINELIVRLKEKKFERREKEIPV